MHFEIKRKDAFGLSVLRVSFMGSVVYMLSIASFALQGQNRIVVPEPGWPTKSTSVLRPCTENVCQLLISSIVAFLPCFVL